MFFFSFRYKFGYVQSNGCSKINNFFSNIFFLNFEISCLKVATPMQFTPKILMKNAISMLYAFQTKKKLRISPLIIHTTQQNF